MAGLIIFGTPGCVSARCFAAVVSNPNEARVASGFACTTYVTPSQSIDCSAGITQAWIHSLCCHGDDKGVDEEVKVRLPPQGVPQVGQEHQVLHEEEEPGLRQERDST